MARLQDKAIFVTGGAQGIGRAAALLMAGEGAKVMIGDIAEAGAAETVRMIRDAGGVADFTLCDVGQEQSIAAAVELTVRTFGTLDCAVNNAGIEGVFTTIADYPIDVFDRVIALNLRGVFLCMQQELRAMLASGKGGAIVNLGSIVSIVGAEQFSAYVAAKHAVAGLTKAAALEYARQGIRVNAVGPAWCETPMVIDRGVRAVPGSDVHREIADLHPMGRLGRPDEIAEAIVWLLSDASSFVTGHTLIADGGYVAR